MFAVACAESDVLNQADIKYFTTISGIIPSPSVCFIQVDLFIKIMKNLKTVWDYYYPSYHIPRTGYQHRVSGYLLERLHSFLLCKWLMDNSEPDINIWHRYTVTTNDFPVHLIRQMLGHDESKMYDVGNKYMRFIIRVSNLSKPIWLTTGLPHPALSRS